MKNIIINKKITWLMSLMLIITTCTTQKPNIEEHIEENDAHESDIELTQEQYERSGITLGKAAKRTIGASLNVNGIIEVPPQGDVSINIPYGGFLKYTNILPGTPVKKGQLLATIENPDFIQFQKVYLENLAQQEFLKLEYERQESLYKEQVSSAKKYQQVKADFKSNEASLMALEAQLKLIGFNIGKLKNGKISSKVNIYSPVDGLVRDVYANIGKYLAPKDVIMDLTNTEDLHVELTVYENDIPKVKKGQKILFTVGNDVSKVREAEVFLLGSGVREDRSVTVHGHLQHEEKGLLPGMYVAADIITDSQQLWTVEETAVVLFNSKNYVFVYKVSGQENNNQTQVFEMREVIVGYTERGFSQVTYLDDAEISAGQIAITGAYTLLAKSKNNEGGHAH